MAFGILGVVAGLAAGVLMGTDDPRKMWAAATVAVAAVLAIATVTVFG